MVMHGFSDPDCRRNIAPDLTGIFKNMVQRRAKCDCGRAGFVLTVTLLATLAAFLAGTIGVREARAAQVDQIRIGGDYSYLKVPEGSGYRWCEDSCRNDVRCKSWTYIRPGSQCRLKRFVAPASSSKCCVSGVKPEPRKKSRRELCADHASLALDQQDENLARKCGYRGGGWDSSYKEHFRACLSLTPRQRRAQLLGRKRALQRCEQNRQRVDRDCQRFAEAAAQIWRSAGRKDCRLAPRPWLADYDRAYDWCRKKEGGVDEAILNRPREKLSACLARGGGPFVRHCDDYARTAVGQYDRSRRNECGFGGNRWNGSYRRHYQWCLKVDPWDVTNETRVRQDALERCLAQGGGGAEGKIACDHYARLASEQTRSNRKQNCGLKGRRWLAGYDRHYAWCSKTSKVNRDAELKYREDELARCFERGGGPYDEACDAYATKSVRQFQKNTARNCGYRGKYWNDSYISHYKWCKNVSPLRFRRKLLERKALLSSCKFGIKLPFARQ